MPVLPETARLKKFYKQTFEIKGGGIDHRHTLLVNPEDLNVSEPAKVSVTETLGGGYVSDFGSAFKTVTITGMTGYKARYNADGELKDGYTELKDFRDKVYRNFLETQQPNASMYWYNWEDEEFYRIQPTNFRLMRNKNEPLLYRYELQFTCLERLGSGGSKPKLGANDLSKLNLMNTAGSLASSISSTSEVVGKF